MLGCRPVGGASDETWKYHLQRPPPLCRRLDMALPSSVAEPHHFYAAPAPGKNFDAAPAPAPAPTLLYSKAKFLK
jgi:hypothetical protein